MSLSEELMWRGFIKDKTFSSPAWLDKPQTFYHGVDGSADSLTIGNLAALMLALHLAKNGWKPVLLVGGATSLVGDPGGKDQERILPDKQIVAGNVSSIKSQIEKLFSAYSPEVVNNIDWLGGVKLLDFLRDTGKLYSMTELIQREFVAERMGEGGSGISYAEFSYTLIQGYDYWHLFKNLGATLQIGGSDQWGNMLSGVDLIRKKESSEAHALSMPLITNKATGRKFGKSEAGAIWLDAKKTSPTRFYQFWINTEDSDVEDYLKIFTLRSKQEINQLMDGHRRTPQARHAQRTLASEVTNFIHGKEETHTAEVVTDLLTGKTALDQVGKGVIEQVRKEIAYVSLPASTALADALVATGLATSKTDARRLISNKAVYINGKVSDKELIKAEDFKSGRLLLRRGKAFKDTALVERI